MLGEMFPNQIRGSALAVCGFAQWFSNYLVAQTFPVMAVGLGLTIRCSSYAVAAVISWRRSLALVAAILTRRCLGR